MDGEEADSDMDDEQVSGSDNWEDPKKVIAFAIIRGTGVIWGRVITLDQNR